MTVPPLLKMPLPILARFSENVEPEMVARIIGEPTPVPASGPSEIAAPSRFAVFLENVESETVKNRNC